MKKMPRPRRPAETRASPVKSLLVVLGMGVFVVMCFGWFMSRNSETRTTESVKAQPVLENQLPLETLAVLDTLNDRSRLIVDAKIIAVPRVVGTPSLRAVCSPFFSHPFFLFTDDDNAMMLMLMTMRW